MAADRTPVWAFETTECHTAYVVTPTHDDGLLALAEAVAQMAQALSKPKTLVRGPDGRAIGIQ